MLVLAQEAVDQAGVNLAVYAWAPTSSQVIAHYHLYNHGEDLYPFTDCVP